jgi:RNA polymerase sigma-70 factor (ECF subfamily)
MNANSFRILGGRSSTEQPLQNENQLVLAAQRGDSGAFQELYENYSDRIFTLIYYSLNDASLAEDVFQTVFVKIFKGLGSFRMESSFLTWVYRVALNECKNRKRGRKMWIPLNRETAELHLQDSRLAPDHQHALKQTSDSVRRAVLELKPKYRAVVVLKYLEELSYEEMAAVLGCSQGTIATRLHRALAILEKRLQQFRPAF